MLGNSTLSVFVKVFNLLDLDNPTNVYGDSGYLFFTFGKYDAEKVNPKLYNINSLDQIFTNPGFFSEPRRVEVGLSEKF